MPPGSGPDYVNAAIAADTDLSPEAALSVLKQVETAFGRARGVRWGPRLLDLDLIDMAGTILPDPATQADWADRPPERRMDLPRTLILPHPRLQERAFVLGPLLDVVPDWRHPVTGRSARDLWADLPEADRAALTPL